MSPAKCEELLKIFISKVEDIRLNIFPSTHDITVSLVCSSTLDSLQSISLPSLIKFVSSMKPAVSPLDIVPTSLLKEVFDTAGPSILSIISCSLATVTVPTCFKHVVVQPLLKTPINSCPAYTKITSWKKSSLVFGLIIAQNLPC